MDDNDVSEVTAVVVALPDWKVNVLVPDTPNKLLTSTNHIPAAFGKTMVAADVKVPDSLMIGARYCADDSVVVPPVRPEICVLAKVNPTPFTPRDITVVPPI